MSVVRGFFILVKFVVVSTTMSLLSMLLMSVLRLELVLVDGNAVSRVGGAGRYRRGWEVRCACYILASVGPST